MSREGQDQSQSWEPPWGPAELPHWSVPRSHAHATRTSTPPTSSKAGRDTPHVFVGILEKKVCCSLHSRARPHLHFAVFSS